MADRLPVTRREWELMRDILLFVAGLVGIFYELFVGYTNSSLLIVFAAMIGLPVTLSHTVSRQEKDEK